MTESKRTQPQTNANTVAFAARLGDLLDKRFVIPGTSIRFGLDPVLGLVPGIGDALANLAGIVILLMAARSSVPRITIARMAINVGINYTLGSIPVIGDLFSLWFKSNVRNAEMLRASLDSPRSTSSRFLDWLVVGAVLVLILGLFIAVGLILAAALRSVWNAL